jgi:hypothetical protein
MLRDDLTQKWSYFEDEEIWIRVNRSSDIRFNSQESTCREAPIRGKENLAMTRATFVMVTVLLVLGCSAAFAQKNLVFGFLESDGVTLACDYESLVISPPYAAGIHVLTNCGLPLDGTLVGFRGSVLPVAHLPVTGGQTYLLADSSADAICDCFTGVQVMLVTASIVNPKKPQFGWESLFNEYESFNAYLGDWGYLTTTIPGDGPVANGPANRPGVSTIQHLIRNNDMMKK